LKNYFSKGLLPPKYKTVLVCSSSGSSKKQTEITSPKETEQNRYPIMEGRFSQELGPVPSSASSGFCPLTRTTPLVDVLLELDTRKILFPPTATDGTLEELLAQSTRDVAIKDGDTSRTQQRQRRQTKNAATERDGVRAATATSFFFCFSQNDKNGKLRDRFDCRPFARVG
jgi:hypothetical protein